MLPKTSGTRKGVPEFLRPENYQYIGVYATSPFGSSFWSGWYSERLAKKVGLGTDFGGWCNFFDGNIFYNKQQVENIETVLRSRVAKYDLSYFRKLISLANKEFATALRLADRLDTAKSELHEKFSVVVEHGRRILFFWCLGWQLSQMFDRVLREEARKMGIQENLVSAYLPQPVTPLLTQQQEARRLRVLLQKKGIWKSPAPNLGRTAQVIRASPKLRNLFEKHVAKYDWIQVINWVGERFTLGKLLEQMTLLKPQLNNRRVPEPPDAFKEVPTMAACGSYLNQAGSEYLSMFANKVLDLLTAVARTASITYREMQFLLPDEIFRGSRIALHVREKVERRKNGSWCVYTDADNSVKIIDDKNSFEVLANRFFPKREVTKAAVIKGQVANAGLARGRARIIVSATDFNKLEKGDVLVTPMTTPDFVLLMQKSSAIVTDMGGLLSHAAIISRELGKPCIIGTKIATQTLHDGDLVEVDAERGIVKILHSA